MKLGAYELENGYGNDDGADDDGDYDGDDDSDDDDTLAVMTVTMMMMVTFFHTGCTLRCSLLYPCSWPNLHSLPARRSQYNRALMVASSANRADSAD